MSLTSPLPFSGLLGLSPNRIYQRVFESLGSKPAEPLARFLSRHDAKRDDAIRLLTQMRDYLAPAAETSTRGPH